MLWPSHTRVAGIGPPCLEIGEASRQEGPTSRPKYREFVFWQLRPSDVLAERVLALAPEIVQNRPECSLHVPYPFTLDSILY